MEYLDFLRNESDALDSRLTAVAVLAGIANALLIGIIIAAGSSATSSPHQPREFALFAVAFLLYIVSRKHVLDRTSRIVEGVVRDVRVRVATSINATELAAFETIGKTKINQALAQDTRSMSDSARVVTSAMSQAVLITFSMLYIAILSPFAFFTVGSLTACLVVVYLRNYRQIRAEIEEAWQEENRFFDVLNDQLEGFNELKVNDQKAKDLLHNDIRRTAEYSEQLKIKTASKFNWNIIFGQSFFYFLIAIIIFILPRMAGQAELPVMKIVSVVLFIIGPLSEVISAAPALARANVATAHVQELERQLSEAASEEIPLSAELPPLESLVCKDLSFTYTSAEDRVPFSVGPINLEILRGQVLFVIGGNGTGKSTFLKLLCGLYAPAAGELLVNAQPVTRSRQADFRARFSIILQDFRLFRRLLGVEQIDHARVDDLLSMLRMTSITQVDKRGHFENMQLSTGQKKRLALLVAEIDDREIYLLDEWAADQDPGFRAYFYNVFLKGLRERGKTAIVATHDDHYFHVADRIVKMTDGRLEEIDIGSARGHVATSHERV